VEELLVFREAWLVMIKTGGQLQRVAPQLAPTAQNAPDGVALAAPTVPSPEQQLNAISLDAIRQIVDRIAANQEQITRTVDRIATSVLAAQDQMTREISKLEAVDHYVHYGSSDPPPRPAAAPAPKPVPRASPAPVALTPAKTP
jgi:hypothetical protein